MKDIALEGVAINIDDWTAWSVSPDGSLIAVAPGARRQGVVVVDVASGVAESRADLFFLSSDYPLFRMPGGQFWDETARFAFAPPNDERSGPDYETFRNDGAGRLVRLTRTRGAGLSLEFWDHHETMTWSVDITPAPDSAGIALSPGGDTIALVQAFNGRSMTVTSYDARDGKVRWSSDASVRASGTPFLEQRVEFSDDGSLIWINGYQSDSTDAFLEARRASDGGPMTTIRIDNTLRNADGDGDMQVRAAFGSKYVWTATIGYSNPMRRHGGPPVTPGWRCDYTLYRLGQTRPIVSTYSHGEDKRTIFGESNPESCSARAFQPLRGGGIVLVQAVGSGLRVTTWKKPPGL